MLTLTQNMRLKTTSEGEESQKLREFATWILNLGDGKINPSIDGCSSVQIPFELLLEVHDDPIKSIVTATYGEYLRDQTNHAHLNGRAILAPTIQVVEEINDYMLDLNKSESKAYLSCNTPYLAHGDDNPLACVHTPEFLATVKSPGLPNHQLCFKEGSLVMLIRNIDHFSGLCNGARLVIKRLGNKVIEAEVISGNNMGEKVFIKMTLTPSDSRLPFKFQRRQFRLMLSYAMTINESQGQSLDRVGLLLKKTVFTHGQLYVAVSRVTNMKGLKIAISHEDSNDFTETSNVVYPKVFRNV